MKEILLNMKEMNMYMEIKKAVNNNTTISPATKNRLALKLNCSIRNINLLINKYKEHGKSAFSHKNKYRKPKATISVKTRNKILCLYKTKYYDFNWKHLCEKLNEVENIKLTYTTLRKILIEAGYISPLAFKKTKRNKKKELLKKDKLTTVDKIIIQDFQILDSEDAHPRKPRAKYFGEVIQMDACGTVWFNNVLATLHLAIDDCTGHVVGAYFDTQETLKGYYNVLFNILNDYGIPFEFLTDRRTVFEYKLKKDPKPEDDTYTQFGYACKTLGIGIKTSSIPQKKGRVERFNGTFQRRLPQEMRLANIQTIEEANKFLQSHLKEFNQRFSLHNKNTKSVFSCKPSNEIINSTLAIIASRKFDNGGSIKYNNKYYQAFKSGMTMPICYYKGADALFIKAFDESEYIVVNEIVYEARELLQNKLTSSNFDENEKPKIKKTYIPPMSHPWKHKSYMKYLDKQKHLNNNANV